MKSSVKLLGALLLVLSFTAAGFYLARRLKRRRDFLGTVITFLSNLSANLRYTKDDITSLIHMSSPEGLRGYLSDSPDFRELRGELTEKLENEKILRRNDLRLVRELFDGLGKTDLEGQLSHIGLYKSLFTAEYNNSAEEYKQKSKLYRLLGFSAGAVTAILLL